jgi:hypothetical protein
MYCPLRKPGTVLFMNQVLCLHQVLSYSVLLCHVPVLPGTSTHSIHSWKCPTVPVLVLLMNQVLPSFALLLYHVCVLLLLSPLSLSGASPPIGPGYPPTKQN